MTKKLEDALLAPIVALMYALIKTQLPDFPYTEQALLALFLYVLAKLGVEVIGKPLLRKFLPRKFAGYRTPPE